MKELNRRELMTATVGLGLAAAALDANGEARGSPPPSTAPGWAYGPFDSLRDYVAELERRGLLIRIPRLDQDAYETTALMYRLIDEYGLYLTPALLIDEVKIDGRWVKGPVIVNQYGHYFTEAVSLGIEPVAGDGRGTYRAAVRAAQDRLENGKFPIASCREVAAADTPCKRVILAGDEIDLTKFAFIQSNPADAGRYVNTGSVFTRDAQGGGNFGTYRCQIKGPRLLGVNPEPGQSGWQMLMKMKERGETIARVSIVLGQDPMTWVVSTSKIGMGNPDELQLVSGLRGRPLDVVKSETNDILVPAHAEMVIEGEIPLDQPLQPEGPFGEMRGYMGRKKAENFWMNVTRVTHRRDPWIVNQFTGVNRGAPSATSNMSSLRGLREESPIVTFAHTPSELPGFGFVSIRKENAGDGLAVGEIVARRVGMAKVIVVVDDDIDVLDTLAVLHATGARWQPKGANKVLTGLRGHQLDPSVGDPDRTSKFVIDATRALPGEGGPAVWQQENRALLVAQAPESFARVEQQWARLVGRWNPPPA
ncbi:MAG: UbiD family decarboxylase [Gammaproteobacteria bacterium]